MFLGISSFQDSRTTTKEHCFSLIPPNCRLKIRLTLKSLCTMRNKSSRAEVCGSRLDRLTLSFSDPRSDLESNWGPATCCMGAQRVACNEIPCARDFLASAESGICSHLTQKREHKRWCGGCGAHGAFPWRVSRSPQRLLSSSWLRRSPVYLKPMNARSCSESLLLFLVKRIPDPEVPRA